MSQATLDAAHAKYMKALYAQPKDERLCKSLAQECLDIAKGSRLEKKFKALVDMHERRINAEAQK